MIEKLPLSSGGSQKSSITCMGDATPTTSPFKQVKAVRLDTKTWVTPYLTDSSTKSTSIPSSQVTRSSSNHHPLSGCSTFASTNLLWCGRRASMQIRLTRTVGTMASVSSDLTSATAWFHLLGLSRWFPSRQLQKDHFAHEISVLKPEAASLSQVL